jgi:hypothetical protein
MPEFAMRRFPAGSAGVEPFRRSQVVCRVAWVFNELSVEEARVRGGFCLVAVCRITDCSRRSIAMHTLIQRYIPTQY